MGGTVGCVFVLSGPVPLVRWDSVVHKPAMRGWVSERLAEEARAQILTHSSSLLSPPFFLPFCILHSFRLHMCVCVGHVSCLPVCVHIGQWSTAGACLNLTPLLFFRAGSLTEPRARHFKEGGWLGSECQRLACLNLRCQFWHYRPAFYMGCVAGTGPGELSP